jgi:hypothetical protein
MRAECPSPGGNRNHLVENNIFLNNAVHIALQQGYTRNNLIRNNTFVKTSPPPVIGGGDQANIVFSTATQNTVKNNIFYSTTLEHKGIVAKQLNDSDNDVNYNVWKVATDKWVWQGKVRNDFRTQYRAVTSWDLKGKFQVDPKFVSVSGKDYNIVASSPARNTGTNSECAATDKDGFLRPEEAVCDIGMSEFVP